MAFIAVGLGYLAGVVAVVVVAQFLHIGCTADVHPETRQPYWMCQDGSEYLPWFALAAGGTAALVVAVYVQRDTRRSQSM